MKDKKKSIEEHRSDEFNKELNKRIITDEKLRLISLKSSLIGARMDEILTERLGYDSKYYTLRPEVKEVWFGDGTGKVVLENSVRGTEPFICCDVYNPSNKRIARGENVPLLPNDLMQQVRDTIGACNNHTQDISIVMPMLYNARQHRKTAREPLSCAEWLHEFDQNPSIKRIFTCDVHDAGVGQAVNKTEFESAFLTNVILEQFINDVSVEELRDLVFVAPDNGAVGRTKVYLNMFSNPNVKKDLGYCYKERDYNTYIDGKNPILSHNYTGNSNIAGKTGCIVDDMISSGGSMFDVIDILNNMGVNNIYIFATFALFTDGIDRFDKYYNDGKFSGIYTTNATHIKDEYQDRPWLHIADSSKTISEFIYYYYKGYPTSVLLNDKSVPVKILSDKFDRYYNKIETSKDYEEKINIVNNVGKLIQGLRASIGNNVLNKRNVNIKKKVK